MRNRKKNTAQSIFQQPVRQNLWNIDQARDFKQVWFAGVHSDVGGGYRETESGLSKIALRWMLDEAKTKGLLVDASARDRVLGLDNRDYIQPDPLAPMHNELPKWWWAEIIPRRRWFAHHDAAGGSEYSREWFLPLAHRRSIKPNSIIHRSVYDRIDAKIGYKPMNVPDRKLVSIEC